MWWLLDTNVVSELRKVRTGRADPNVVAWAASVSPADFAPTGVALFNPWSAT